MTTHRRSRRPRRDDDSWSEYYRSGTSAAATSPTVTPSVAEAELLLEEARRAEAEHAAALARDAEEERRRQASLEREAAIAVAGLEERLEAELAIESTAEAPIDRELRGLSRRFLHGIAPRGAKRVAPEDLIAARDDAAARLLEIAREADLTYDKLTGGWADVPLPADDPFVGRADAVEHAAWRAFVERVRILAGEPSPVRPRVSAPTTPDAATMATRAPAPPRPTDATRT